MALLKQFLFPQPCFVPVHPAVRAVEHVLCRLIFPCLVFRQSGSHNRPFAHPDMFFHLPSQTGNQALPIVIILPPEDHGEFIPADPEHRTVMECAANQSTGTFDVFIPCLVSLRIVDRFQSVNIADHDSKDSVPLPDLLLQFILRLVISRFVFHMGQFIPPGNLIGHGKLRQVLLLPADVLIAVLNANDEMAVIGGIRHRHTSILRFPAVDSHAVILGHPPPVLKPGNQTVPVKEQADPLPILGIDQPIDILSGRFKKIFPLVLYLQFAGFLSGGQFRIIRILTVYVINQVIMGSQRLSDLCKGDAFLLIRFQG